MESLNPFSSEASSMEAHADYDVTSHIETTLTHYQSEDHILASNQPSAFQHLAEDQHGDLQADFSREGTLNHNFLDGHFVPAMTSGRGDETEEVDQENSGSNPFITDAINQEERVESSENRSSMPPMGYNPFLNDDKHLETDEMDDEDEHTDNSQEEIDHFQEQGSGGPFESTGREQTRVNAAYNLLEEEEDDADIQMEPVENVQHFEEVDEEDGTDVANEERAFDDHLRRGNGIPQQSSALVDEYIGSGSEDTHVFEQDQSITDKQPNGNDFGGSDFAAHSLGADMDLQDNFRVQRNCNEYEYQDTYPAHIDSEMDGFSEEQRKDDLGKLSPQTGDHAGSANGGISQNVAEERGETLKEEELVEYETARKYDNNFDDYPGTETTEKQYQKEEEMEVFEETHKTIKDEEVDKFQEVCQPKQDEGTERFQEVYQPKQDEDIDRFQEVYQPKQNEDTIRYQDVYQPKQDEDIDRFQEVCQPYQDEDIDTAVDQPSDHYEGTDRFQEAYQPKQDEGTDRFQETYQPKQDEGTDRFQETYQPKQDEGTDGLQEVYQPKQDEGIDRFQEVYQLKQDEDMDRAVYQAKQDEGTHSFQEVYQPKQDEDMDRAVYQPKQDEGADRYQDVYQPKQDEDMDRAVYQPKQDEGTDRFQEVYQPKQDEDMDRAVYQHKQDGGTDSFQEAYQPKQDEGTDRLQEVYQPKQDEGTDRLQDVYQPKQDEDMDRAVYQPKQDEGADRYQDVYQPKRDEEMDRYDEEEERLEGVQQSIKNEEVEKLQEIEQKKEYTENISERYTSRPNTFSNVEQSITAERGHLQEQIGSDELEMKKFGTRYEKDSDIMSSEYEDRSFVDNLSELTSPADTIPQPLPSPPEPTTMSPFDPLAPTDSPSPEPDGDLDHLGQNGAVTLENNAAIFGEMEAETKFGVDGTAITSTSQNNSFLHSDEDDGSQNLELGGFTTTGTTETETSIDGEYGNGRGFEEQMEGNNALMSMSMEGSFYDDGGELMGGDDRRNQQQSHLYEDGYITEESSQHDSSSYEAKQENYVVKPDEFGQRVLNEYELDHDNDHPHQGDNVRNKSDDFDPTGSETAPVVSAVNGVCDKGHLSDLDSLLDAPVTAQGLQTPVTVHGGTAVDYFVETNSAAQASEYVVNSQVHQQQSEQNLDTLGGVNIADVPSEKVEKPLPKDAADADEKGKSGVTSEAAATTTAAAVAGNAAATVVTKTTTVKKSPAKSDVKTPTTLTTTTKITKSTNGKASTTKKLEVTTTTSKPSPRKPSDTRPTSATSTERKTPAKAASPTKSAGLPTSIKSTTPLPSYALPITPRKPREAKTPTTEEKKKTPTTRASSAAPLTPRPQTVAASTSSTSASTTTKTTVRTSITSTTSRTAQLARPKSSPTKLTNGIASPSDTTKSPTKKYGIDSKNEGYKPGGGNVKIISEKNEYKTSSKVDAGSKSLTSNSMATKSPTKQTSLASPKSGEVKSKIGSLDGANHTPGGGNVKIIHKKMDFTNISSKIGSKDNMDYKPGGGNVKIENRKVKVEAKSKIGSLDNAAHKPGGGDKKIEVQKTEWKAQSKIGSLDNTKHIQDGGGKQTDKSDLKEKIAQNGLVEQQGSDIGSGAAELLNGLASEI